MNLLTKFIDSNDINNSNSQEDFGFDGNIEIIGKDIISVVGNVMFSMRISDNKNELNNKELNFQDKLLKNKFLSSSDLQ